MSKHLQQVHEHQEGCHWSSPEELGEAQYDYEQPRGNAAAMERLGGGPVDIDAIDQSAGAAAFAVDLVTSAETQADVYCNLSELVEAVKQKAGGRAIGRLTIHGHGRPGEMTIGHDSINKDLSPQAQAKLAELAPLFSEEGRVELHGCNFGAGKDGEDMLYVLHELWGVPVTAGIAPQNGLIPGYEGSTVTGSTDEEGFFRLDRDESPVADAVHQWLSDRALDVRDVYDAASGSYEELQLEAEQMLADVEVPEVGDLAEWLFGD